MREYFNPSLAPYYSAKDRRIALITGGNSGIGWFTVLHLYLHGYKVYIAGRSTKRVEKAIQEIHEEANNRNVENHELGELKYLHMDLTDLKSVEKAALKFKKLENHLDLLIDNAGVMALPFSLTSDGYEIQMQTNYIAHVLLDQLLLPMFESSNDPRIIYISSIGHNFCFKQFAPTHLFNYWPNIIFTWFRYGMAKTFGIHYMKILALKYPKILTIAVHPGFVLNTNLFAYWTRLPLIGTFFWIFFQMFGWVFGVSNEEGSLATLKAAMDVDIAKNEGVEGGAYIATGGIVAEPSKVANNMDYAIQTYNWTIKGLRDRGFKVDPEL